MRQLILAIFLFFGGVWVSSFYSVFLLFDPTLDVVLFSRVSHLSFC